MFTAFGKALCDATQDPSVEYLLSLEDGPPVPMNCLEYLFLRQEELALLEEIALPERARVLDLGCGLGRYFAKLREMRPEATLIGIEQCGYLRAHCEALLEGSATFYPSLDCCPDTDLDLIIASGNGLGIHGDEASTEVLLDDLCRRLAPGGHLLLETGNVRSDEFRTLSLVVRYQDLLDGPFPWGNAGSEWTERALSRRGLHVSLWPSRFPGMIYFFALAQKPRG